MDVTVLLVLGSIIIIALAWYAGYLLIQLKKQKVLQQQHLQMAIDKRNSNIFENVQTLCNVGIQGQCDLSEIVIRVYCIMDYVQGDQRVDFEKDFPSIAELYHVVKDMPRGEDRKAMDKKTRMEQNLVRMKTEAKLQDAIVNELQQLKSTVTPLNNQISVQMV